MFSFVFEKEENKCYLKLYYIYLHSKIFKAPLKAMTCNRDSVRHMPHIKTKQPWKAEFSWLTVESDGKK